jgi:superfamily II DNA/RNA helicase
MSAPTRPSTSPSAAVDTAAGDLPTFAELGVPEVLISDLRRRGITAPFPIQAAAIPAALAGRDLLGRGRTGSGKTVAFSVPTVLRLDAAGRRRQRLSPRALILVPTRELANQVRETIAPLAEALGQRTAVVVGGTSYRPQIAALTKGVDILIATPGRLEDLIQAGNCRLDAVEVTVLDEADHMADLGFLPPVTRLLEATPADAQRLFFSATLDGDIDVLVRRFTTDAVVVEVDPPVAAAESPMEHHVFAVAHAHKPVIVRDLAAGHGRTLFFTRTKHAAKRLAENLTKSGIPSTDLHGNLSQRQRERNLKSFSDGQVRVLVATDIAARGIHVDGIDLVVHVDPPADPKTYLHRSGRTARAGAGGTVVTLATPNQNGIVRTLSKHAGVTPQRTLVTPGHEVIEQLRGPAAPTVEPQQPRQPAAEPSQRKPRRAPVDRPRRAADSDRPRRASTGKPKRPTGGRPGGARGNGGSGGGSGRRSGPPRSRRG